MDDAEQKEREVSSGLAVVAHSAPEGGPSASERHEQCLRVALVFPEPSR
jgi:hypothetical protein